MIQFVKLLHSLKDAVDYWFTALQTHIIDNLSMDQYLPDSVFIFINIHGTLIGLTSTYVDEKFYNGSASFELLSKL